MQSSELFPTGTPVRVRQMMTHRGQAVPVDVVGTVESWEDKPTGSWYAHGKKDRLWLKRLKLRKVDGEFTNLVIDDSTHIARLESSN